MILVDISGLLHKAISNSIKYIPPQKDIIDRKKYKKPFIDNIISELVNVQLTHQNTYGNLIICFDYKGTDSYWRKDIYPEYKGTRKAVRSKSDFDYKDVYEIFNELKYQLENNTPWKCVTGNRAEADDVILVLSREFGKHEKILIYSADKDLIQAQHNNPKVDQYSHQTKKWIVPENKHDHMDHWFLEHQCLGDMSDNIYHILANTEFSDSFKNHLVRHKIHEDFHEVHKFRTLENTQHIFDSFKEYKKVKADGILTLDIYKDSRLGPINLSKLIVQYGSLNNFLDSNPIIRENYELNCKLIMEDGIPKYVWNNILESYNNAKVKYNQKEFDSYLDSYNLFQAKMDVMKVFYNNCEKITLDDLNW